MTYEIVDNFAAGLDTRKSPLTSAGGTLTILKNAMITPGGEIAKRRAFVRIADLPANSFGLASTESKLAIFGKNVVPTPPVVAGVTITGLKVPNSDPNIKQLDYDVFDGKIYLACQAPGATYPANNPHYYDMPGDDTVAPNTMVETEGTGKGYYVRTYQSKVYSVLGKYLYFSAVNDPMLWEGGGSEIAAASVVLLSNSNPTYCVVSFTDIGKFTNGTQVLIEGATGTGMTAANGVKTISSVYQNGGSFVLDGTDTSTGTGPQLSGVTAKPVIHVTNLSKANPAICTVNAADAKKLANGMQITVAGAVGTGLVNANGTHNIYNVNSPLNTFTLYGVDTSSAAGPQTSGVYFTLTTDAARTGAGYINVSLQDADSETLSSLEVYYDKLSIFSTEATQIWAVDPDPLQNAYVQLLRGTGTGAPRSPLQYGSGDVLYLDQSGIRSLKARDSSNSASVSDIGSPVDPTLRTMRLDPTKLDAYMNKAIALLEPSVGRFWMVFPNEVLVLSYFPGPKITAWSTQTLPFTMEHAVTCGGRIYFRDNANGLWVYGGMDGLAYDNCGVEIRLPYLNGKKPGHNKIFEAVDMTCEGSWEVRASFDVTSQEAEDLVGNFTKSTWSHGRAEMTGYGSHISLRFYNNDDQPATLSNVALHYQVVDDEQ